MKLIRGRAKIQVQVFSSLMLEVVECRAMNRGNFSAHAAWGHRSHTGMAAVCGQASAMDSCLQRELHRGSSPHVGLAWIPTSILHLSVLCCFQGLLVSSFSASPLFLEDLWNHVEHQHLWPRGILSCFLCIISISSFYPSLIQEREKCLFN